MKYRLLQNLGLDDARHCNSTFSTKLSLEAKDLKADETVDLNDAAFEYLSVTRGYTALLEPEGKIKGEAKAPEVGKAK